jgi:predicted transcriptional regulator
VPWQIAAADALDHPRRQQLLALIREDPGASFRAIARLLDMQAGTVRHHLNVLRRSGLIVERIHGATTRFFDAEARDDDWVGTVLRRDADLATLHDWLKLNPRASQGQVLHAMAAKGWQRSTTQHRLKRLVEGGLAAVFAQGRYKLYTADSGAAGGATAPSVPSGSTPYLQGTSRWTGPDQGMPGRGGVHVACQ